MDIRNPTLPGVAILLLSSPRRPIVPPMASRLRVHWWAALTPNQQRRLLLAPLERPRLAPPLRRCPVCHHPWARTTIHTVTLHTNSTDNVASESPLHPLPPLPHQMPPWLPSTPLTFSRSSTNALFLALGLHCLSALIWKLFLQMECWCHPFQWTNSHPPKTNPTQSRLLILKGPLCR